MKNKDNVAPKNTGKKKSDKTDEVLVKNTIEINPKLEEAKNKTVVLGWGRMNPITIGHEKLANKIKDVAKKNNATPLIYLTHSQNAKKDPLQYSDKIRFAQKAFGNVVQKSNSKTIIQVMQELQGKFNNLILIVGSDRIKEFETLLNKYNGKDYTFDSIKIVSAGERDADADGVEGMSASKMREAASTADDVDATWIDSKRKKQPSFRSGLPKKIQRDAQAIWDMVRAGMKLAEELEAEGLLDEAVLNFQQRRKRAITMRKFKNKIAMARKRQMRKAAGKEKLQKRARKKAINLIRSKVAGKAGKSYGELSISQKMMIDKKVEKRKGLINRISKRLVTKVRRADRSRLGGGSGRIDEEFMLFLEGQDSDIGHRKGSQPDIYHTGLSKSTKEKRDAHFKKGAKMDDDNPAAYKPAPGDKESKTKESKHTKKYKAMYGEEVSEASKLDEKPKKRYHEARKKDGSIKLDGRFKIFKKKPQQEDNQAVTRLKNIHKGERENLKREHEKELDVAKVSGLKKQIRRLNAEDFNPEMESFANDSDLLAFIEETVNDIYESIQLEEKKSESGLKAKAEKSGISLSILKKVYDRGVAAWRTGHRPGTTPQQWGFARVNSFITGGKTRTTADADLWKQHRGIKEDKQVSPAQQAAIAIAKKKEMKEDEKGPCWPGYKQVGMKTKNGKEVPNCVPEETQLDEWVCGQCNSDPCTCESINELFEKYMDHDPWRLKKAASVTVNRKMYKHALEALKKLLTRKRKEAGGKGMKHGSLYYAATIAKSYDGVDTRTLHNMLDEEYVFEEGGAGDYGTEKVTKNYKKDTPGEAVNESIDDLFEARFKVDVDGLPTMFVDAKSPGEVRANLRKKLKKPDDVQSIERVTPEKIKQHFRMVVRGEEDPTEVNEDVTQKQISDLEKFADRLLDKFGVDVEFTRHFADRMNDDRNDPKITIPELQRFFKKIAKNKAKDIKQNADSEAVLNDIQADLNLPVVINFDRDKEEFEVVNKTIMRKKNFKTSNKVIKY